MNSFSWYSFSSVFFFFTKHSLTNLASVFTVVPWPENFRLFTMRFNFINLDIISGISVGSCQLAVPFFEKFIIHMILPIVLWLVGFLAYKIGHIFQV